MASTGKYTIIVSLALGINGWLGMALTPSAIAQVTYFGNDYVVVRVGYYGWGLILKVLLKLVLRFCVHENFQAV